MGSAAVSAIAAARLAVAGLARLTGLATTSLGRILGEFEPTELTPELGRRFDLGNAYFKRHASCSYTHPAADAVLDIRASQPDLEARSVREVLVETYPIAATLNRARADTRLASMFSIPYVVATVLVAGHAGPEAFDDQHRAQPEIRRLMQATRVVATEEFARRLPDERGARVTLGLEDGSTLVGEVPNPVGDTAYHPFGLPEVRAKLDALLPPGWDAERFEALVRELVSAPDVNPIVEQMP
jgi:2-methylcitrate dehydratase PrpD